MRSQHLVRLGLRGSLATALLATLTACGAHTPDPADSTSSPADVRTDARRVYESFAGTTLQRNAGYVLEAHAHNAAMDQCMEERGFPGWDWSLSRQYAAPVDPLAASDWFAGLEIPVWSQNEMAMRSFLDAERQMNEDDPSKEHERAVTECLGSTERTSDADASKAASPAVARELQESWRSMLRQADRDLGGELADYSHCMNQLPILVDAGAEYDELGGVMSGEAGKAGPPPAPEADPSTHTPQWKHFLAVEQEVLSYDADCRREVYDEGIGSLGPLIAAFADEHAAEIRAAQDGWSEIEDAAADLGYHGQQGPLGG